jgi:hypothetical protein
VSGGGGTFVRAARECSKNVWSKVNFFVPLFHLMRFVFVQRL